jgi:hypothetical protein
VGKEGDPDFDFRSGMASRLTYRGLTEKGESRNLADQSFAAQDNAGKTTLLYRLKVRRPVDRKAFPWACDNLTCLSCADRRGGDNDTHNWVQR